RLAWLSLTSIAVESDRINRSYSGARLSGNWRVSSRSAHLRPEGAPALLRSSSLFPPLEIDLSSSGERLQSGRCRHLLGRKAKPPTIPITVRE
ncbi:MAG: hypothetical protein QW639_05080, partial [Candidatus Bathyarchaeia archaeon]